MQAITVKAMGGPAIVERRPTPKLRPGYMLVEVVALALNPADVLVVDLHMATPGSLLGCDYAGVVLDVGDGVERTFEIGDRVCGMTRSADPRDPEMGVFAEQIIVKADLQLHLPDGMTLSSGAALGVAVVTTGRCLFDRMRIPYPSLAKADDTVASTKPKGQILIYGGSTCMGTMLIQFAKLAGMHVLSTASPQNQTMVKSYGADLVVDHNHTTAAEELIAHAKENEAQAGSLLYCVDTIGSPQTAQLCARVLNQDPALEIPAAAPPSDLTAMMRQAHSMTDIQSVPNERIYSAIVPVLTPLPGITTVLTLGYSFLGEPWEQAGVDFPASQKDFEDSRRFAKLAETFLNEKKIIPHPIESRGNGFHGIVDSGLPDLKQKKVSGKKLVFPL